MADKTSFAVVCSSNMNRSMEAHAYLRRKGFDVRSFGTGNKVKLPGKSAGRPNVYDFGCPYDTIYKDLVNKDEAFYTQTGLLNMLDRNRRVKNHPEKFQLCKERFTVIITCEEKVYDEIFEYFESLNIFGNILVHIINIEIEDNQEEATIGAFLICELVSSLSKSEDLDNNITRIINEFEDKYKRLVLHGVHFY